MNLWLVFLLKSTYSIVSNVNGIIEESNLGISSISSKSLLSNIDEGILYFCRYSWNSFNWVFILAIITISLSA